MSRRRSLVFSSLALGALLLVGCGGYVAFEVDTQPQGAKVFVDGEFRGVTPTAVMVLPTSGQVRVTLELLNFKPMAWSNTDMFETREQAKKRARAYLWNLSPRRP